MLYIEGTILAFILYGTGNYKEMAVNLFMLNKKLLLVDGNSILNRAFYGLQGPQLLSTSDGLYTNGVYGFLNILFKYIEEEQPGYICIAFDMKGPTFRHEQYEEYKANRKEMPQELAVQVPIIKEVLDAMNYKRIEYEGYEADDLIGWLSRCGEEKGMEVIIVTGDRDSFQLISNTTRVKLPVTRYGKTETEDYDYVAFHNKYGIEPKQMIDVKALMGDASDNIPGIKGIGEKTALKLIKEFGSLDDLYKNIQDVKSNSIRRKLEEEKEIAYLSKELASIKREVPEDLCKLEQLEIIEYDVKKLYEIFQRLEFRSFIDRLELQRKVHSNIEIEEEKQLYTNDKNIFNVENLDELRKLKDIIKKQKSFSFFHILDDKKINKTENFAGNLLGLALTWNEKEGDSTFIRISNEDGEANSECLDSTEISKKNLTSPTNQGIKKKDFLAEFKEIFEDESIEKYAHDIKNFLIYLKDENINLKGLSFDTMIGAYILNPGRETYLVAELTKEYLDKDIIVLEDLFSKKKGGVLFESLPNDYLTSAACQYSRSIFSLHKVINKLMEENQQKALYYDIELPLVEILADMEYSGFKVNKEELVRFSHELDNEINYLTKEIYRLVGEEFNINSPKQLGVILFEKLGLPIIKRTKTGYSTAAEVLEQLMDEHAVISYILDYRQHTKLKTTYAEGLINMINPRTGRIHSKFNQTVVVTGRISSMEPNLQNIPIKLEMGRKIRKVFEPSNESFILVDADYSQIELRVLAHISEDENLINAFINNEDIHASTAAKVFGVPLEEVTSIMRARAKAVNFGIIYGIGDFSLGKDLGISRKEAKNYIDGYLDKYPGVKQYMHDTVLSGRKLGYVKTMYNRRRYLPELASKNFTIKSFGERVALNMPIQGSAADIIKIAMAKVYRKLKEDNMKSKLILQVHDELIIEAHVEEKERVVNIIKDCMETAVALKVPLKADISMGKNWYEVK